MPLKQLKNTAADKSLPCQDGVNTGETPELNPAIAKVMETMTTNFTTVIDNKLERMLHSTNSNILQHLKEMNDRIGEAEGRILMVENTTTETEKHVASLTKSVKELTEHLQDHENRGRRKNLRILGLSEKTEGNDVVKFMEQWIPQALGLNIKAGRIKLEQAHRIPGPTTSKLPRAIIVRFHNFSDRQKVMEAA